MTDITNDNAVEVPSNYEVCQRTGFRVPIGELVKEWSGLWVRKQSLDPRHPQDLVRARPEKERVSRSPQPDEAYIADDDQVETTDL